MPHAEHFAMYVDSYRKSFPIETNNDLNNLVRSYCGSIYLEGVLRPSKNPPTYLK